MSRIKLDDSVMDVFTKMSGGNPDALTVIMELNLRGERIDPDNAFGGLGPIMFMDTLGIYEERIWMLYKDVCNEDLGTMVALLRAVQLGFLRSETLSHAIDSRGDGVDVEVECDKVIDHLPKFNING